MRNGNEASPRIILAVQALLVKMLKKLLTGMVYFDKILYAYVFYHFPATVMQNVDKTSLSITLVSQAFLVKMLITLEPHGIFGLNFVYSFF